MQPSPTLLSATLLLSSAIALAQLTPQQSQLPTLLPDSTIQVDVKLLLLPVVVRDAQGHAIGNLKKEDFKVFDQGKSRTISNLSLEQTSATPQPIALQPAASSTSPAPASTIPPRFTVFLFDDRHLNPSDLEDVKTASSRLFDLPMASEDRAIVLSFAGINSGITRDPAVLKAAVAKLKSQPRFGLDEHACLYIDYYSANQIVNLNSQREIAIATEKAYGCQHGVGIQDTLIQQNVMDAARRALGFGDEDARLTLNYIRDVVHSVSKLPGHRSLILVSPGFLTISQDAMNYASQIVDMAAASNLTISTLDSQGLYAGSLGAHLSGEGSLGALQSGDLQQVMKDSRLASQETLSLFADGTGGTFIHNTNDLAGGFQSLAATPEYVYVLALPITDVKPNGTYHQLKVELTQKSDPALKIQARRGYFAPRPPKAGK